MIIMYECQTEKAHRIDIDELCCLECGDKAVKSQDVLSKEDEEEILQMIRFMDMFGIDK